MIIGCGGVAYHLSDVLARLIADETGTLYLVDGKTVREKNIDRQYGTGHIGKPKSECLRDKILQILPEESELTVMSIPTYVGRDYADSQPWFQSKNLTIFCCVDNKASRILIEDICLKLRNVTLICGGNDDISGQAVIFKRKGGRNRGPLPSEIDPEIANVDDDLPDEIPCDVIVESEPQTALANSSAGNAMLMLWYSQVLHKTRKTVGCNYITFSLTKPIIQFASHEALQERK